MKLSPRLQAIYNELTPGLSLTDICCDHGYLGMHAYLTQQFPEIIFLDQVPMAMELLEKKFHQYCKNEENRTNAQFITADAKTVSLSANGNVVIAGVGGINMMQILENLFQSPDFKPKKLILSPHRNDELYEKKELFNLKHTHTASVMESGYTRSIFVFSA